MSIISGAVSAPGAGPGGGGMIGTPHFGPGGNGSNGGTDYTGTVWGMPIPLSMGFRLIPGAILWAGPIVKSDVKSTYTPPPFPGSFGITDTTWLLKQSFAISLGKRLNPSDAPPLIRRVWANGALVYANGTGQPLSWGGLGQDYLLQGQYINGVWVPDPGTPGAQPLPLGTNGATPPLQPIQSLLTFRFYPGDETQLPDQELVDDLGDLAPAFRGLMYMVIDGLVVGKGSDFEPGGGDLGNQGALSHQSALPSGFPQINVELADGTAVAVGDHDFTMIPSSVPFPNPSEVLLANWTTKELAVIAPSATTLGTLHLFDTVSTTETASIAITGSGTDTVGPTSGFAVWDKRYDIFYTERANNNCICSLNRNGQILSTAMQIGTDLGPVNVDATTITDAKPAIIFPRPAYGGVGYVMKAGFSWPIVLAGKGNWIAAFSPSQGGVLPTTLRPRQFYETTGDKNLESVQALELFTTDDPFNLKAYQDACFLVATDGEVQLVYVSTDVSSGGVSTSNILARHTIYSAALGSGSNTWAFLDKSGNACIWEYKTGTGGQFTKIKIDYTQPNDLTIAPTFKGTYPKAGATLVGPVSSSITGVNVLEGNTVANSDVSQDTILNAGMLIDLTSGKVTFSSSLAAASSTTAVWDSKAQVAYYHGNITGVPPAFSGVGLKFGQVYEGISSGAETLSTVIKDIAEAAGYADADLTIDTKLTDEIPGVVIDHPYEVPTLFNDIGAVYQFSFFDSGGKLKFTRVSNTPIKAIGGCEFGTATTGSGLAQRSVTVADGDTATVGTVVYRFKTTPSAPFDVKIMADTDAGLTTMVLDANQKTAANFLAALNGDLSLASDPINGFFPGTVRNPKVDAAATSGTVTSIGFLGISFTAHIGGSAGNTIPTSTTSTHLTMDTTFLHDGQEVADAVVTLTINDLALVQEQQISQNDALITTINPAGLAQQAAAVSYYALEQMYTPQTQTFIPDSQNGALANLGAVTVTYHLPFVMSTSEAYARVAQTAIRAGDEVVSQQFRLTQKFLLLEPSDVIAIQLPPYQYQVRIDEATFNGDLSTSFSANNYTFRSDITVQDSDSQGNSWVPQLVPTASDGIPVAVDMPILDARAGGSPGYFDLLDGIRAYFFGFGQGSLSASLIDADGNATVNAPLLTTSNDVKWGTVIGNLPTAVEPFYRTVEDSITISCKTINPATDLVAGAGVYLDMVQGNNAILVGHPGAWELIYFRDVTVINSKLITLTGLVRAQRGTDAAVALHDSTDVVLLVRSVAPNFTTLSLRAQTLSVAQVGNTYRYTAVGSPASRAPTSLDINAAGLNLYPFSPCLMKAVLAGGNDLNLSWVRRDRLSTAFVTSTTPMSETSELYDLEIMSGSTVVRTVTGLTTPAYTYTSANQTTDGFSPPLSSLKFRVYQKGELGRGFPRMETVNVQ